MIIESLCGLNLPGSLVDQVILLARGVAKKDKALASSRVTLSTMKMTFCVVQGYLESLHIENSSLLKN